MSENNNILEKDISDTAKQSSTQLQDGENAASHHSSGHHHHHHHHHHHSSERSHSSGHHHSENHSSSGHHHSEHHSSSGHHHAHKHHTSSSKSKKTKGFMQRFKKSNSKRSGKKFSSHKWLSKFASKTKSKKVQEYAMFSRRLIFGLVVLCIIIYTMYLSTIEEEDPNTKAQYTPSETSQLKSKVTSLQTELDKLQAELDKYKAIYGELDEEKPENNTK